MRKRVERTGHCLEEVAPQLPGNDGYAFALRNLPERIYRLRHVAQEHSKQYRGFRVASELTATSSRQTPQHFDAAVNYPVKGGPKMCAEKGALMHVIEHGFEDVQMILATGDVQADQKTGISWPTLPPCAELCQPMLKRSGLVSPLALVVTVGLQGYDVGVQTFGELTTKYEGETLPLDEHFTDPGFVRLGAALDVYMNKRLVEPSAAVARMALTGQI